MVTKHVHPFMIIRIFSVIWVSNQPYVKVNNAARTARDHFINGYVDSHSEILMRKRITHSAQQRTRVLMANQNTIDSIEPPFIGIETIWLAGGGCR